MAAILDLSVTTTPILPFEVCYLIMHKVYCLVPDPRSLTKLFRWSSVLLDGENFVSSSSLNRANLNENDGGMPMVAFGILLTK